MFTIRLLYLIGFAALSASPAWAQVGTGEPGNEPEIETQVETEVEAETSTDCVENQTCQKVQSEDDKQKAQQDPAEVVDPPVDGVDEPEPEM